MSQRLDVNITKYDKEISKSYRKPINANNSQNTNNHNIGMTKNKKIKMLLFIILPILIIVTVFIIIFIFLRIPANISEKPLEQNNYTDIVETDKSETNNLPQDHGPLESEFTINTKVNDLKRIFVHQKYNEDIVSNAELTKILVDRKTYYDIYIISESESNKETKNYYNKTYLGVIVISSQCISTEDENCEPKNLVNFVDPDYSKLRNLQEIDDLKDIPIPICLFNLTNNNVITSMICPETLSENIKQNMILDLYFFRPPAIKRLDDKVELGIIEDKNNNKKYIREKNRGICDLSNQMNSYCTTEMNTTTDLDNNLLSYDEIAYTQITTDEYNYYIKNKITNLVDISKDTKLLNPEKFNETLSNFLEKLNPYMKYKEHFSNDNFKELYSVSKKLPIKEKRTLTVDKPTIIHEESIFNFKHYGGVEVGLFLKNNLGYNSEAMEALMNGKINDYTEELSNSKEFSNIDKIIKKLIYLSKAGNKLSNDLRRVIEENFFATTQIIRMNISSLNKKIVYKNISELFDPRLYLKYTSILPFKILKTSNELVNGFSQLLSGIENGSLKKNINILNTNIYKYIQESHILVNIIFNNIKDLGDTLNSKKNKLTEISTYYSEHSQTSYINIIKDAENILMNYYKKENDTINDKIDLLIQNLEENLKNSLEKEMNSVNEIYNNLINETMKIEDATNEDNNQTINNLYDINNYVFKIIKEIKDKIGKEIDIKDSNYTISLNDIQSKNITFSQTLEKAKEIAIKLDNDSYIDKVFDEVMTKFRGQFTYIIKYMDEKKNEYSPLIDNNLKDSFFTLSEQNNFSNELMLLRAEIVDFIKKENNNFLDAINNKIDNFLLENKDFLNQLIYNISNSLSEKFLKEISDLYDIGFNNYLSRIENDNIQNEILTNNYFCNLKEILGNDSKINELNALENPIDTSLPNYYKGFHDCQYGENKCYWIFLNYTDLIKTKKKTEGYLNKYYKFKQHYKDSNDYLDSTLYQDLNDKYKNIITKTKKILQSIKDNKITNEYPNYKQLDFIDNNIKDIDELYNRLNNYLSDDIFNKKYNQKIENFKSNQKDKIENITSNIENNHKIIDNYPLWMEYNKDFCFTYKRKKTFACTNGVVSFEDETETKTCLYITDNSNNNNNLTTPSIDDDNKLKEFTNKFENFYLIINQNAISYIEKINELRNIISSTEIEIINKERDSQYLTRIQNEINNILSKKYGDELIKGSYEYYQTLNENFDILFYNISDLWRNAFDELENNINQKIDEFTHSTQSFGLMALLYENLITLNITHNYFNFIHNHLKSEFNYTIIYYYNFLFKEINSAYQYIINQIPTNNGGLNNIINQRKNEINDVFKKLKEDIEKSKIEALSINNQIDVLNNTSKNFFNLNAKLVNHIRETSEILKNKANDIFSIYNGIPNDEYTLACEFYLENIESGKQIDKFYEPITQKVFVDLDSESLKELLKNNLKFDKKKFENDINLAISDSNQRILNLYSIKKKNYENMLENEITQFFTKETFFAHIDSLFNNEIKNLDNNKTEEIMQIVEEIINKIKNHLSNEAKKITSTSNSYTSDFSLINETINNYKEIIFIKIKEAIFKTIEKLYININQNIYNKQIKTKLDEYLNKATEYNSSKTEEYELINYSFNIRNIIYEIVKNLVEKYENMTESSIKYLYEEYIKKVSNDINLNSIKKLIFTEIDNEYNSTLLNTLKKYAIYKPGDTGYYEYDLSEEIKEDINATINLTVNNIDNIMQSVRGDDNFKGNLSLIDIDFSRVDVDVFNKIISNFQYFILPEKQEQQSEINTNIKKIIENNFNDSLNNAITYFGKDFFERIISYNENYKISTLYQNLKYSLVITLQYYSILHGFKDVEALTKDLKLKLFNLNNLDLRAQKENDKILKLLNEKIDTFIQESKYEIVNKYISYIEANDENNTFNEEIIQIINENIEKSKSDMQDNYETILNQIFKEKFITSYTKIMNSETKEMIDLINTQKEIIKSSIEDIFSIETENLLININNKINNTANSIEDFNNHLNQLIISDDLSNYLNSYGKNYIQPLYEGFTTLISESTKDKIISNLNLNVKEFEKNINEDEILNNLDILYTDLNNYFNNVNNSITHHGIEEYPNNLDNEIFQIEQQSRRRLNKEETEEDILDKFKIPDKSVDENFKKILNSSKNTKNFVKTFEGFEEFENNISSNIKNLNISYDASKKSIIDNFNISSEILFDKLQYLQNKTLTYYKKINESFCLVKNYIYDSIYEFDKLLKQAANITYQEFTNKYEEISNQVKTIDSEELNTKEDYKIENNTSIFQNGKYITDVEFKDIIKNAKFEFKLEFEDKEGDIKKPKVFASIINTSRPKKVVFKIYSMIGTCGKYVQEITIDFNNLNYTTNIDFNTNSTNIYASIFADFEPFIYKTKKYEISDKNQTTCTSIMDVPICVTRGACNEKNPKIKESEKVYTQNRVNYTKTLIMTSE